MNEHEVFEQLRKLLGLTKVQSNKSKVVRYQKFVQTGEFKALSDYGEGFLVISFYMLPSATVCRYQVRFCVSTIDDGSWGAWSNEMPLEKARQCCNKLEKTFESMVVLPDEEKMNHLLGQCGLYGVYEG